MGWEDIAKWLWTVLAGLGWWAFKKQDTRMDTLEAAMTLKADKEELDRQRSNISNIFEKIEEVRKDMTAQYAELLKAIYESRK